MNQTPTIVMSFKPGKPTEIRVEGVKGPTCHSFSAAFEALLGPAVSVTPTPEAGEVATATVETAAKVQI